MGFHTTVTFTLIRPSATFSLREKDSDRTRLANKEAPKGRHILARGEPRERYPIIKQALNGRHKNGRQ